MNEYIEEVQTVNFLKGILWNCIENRKLDLAIKFLDDNKELMDAFEASGVLNYGIKVNKHSKRISQAILDLGYCAKNDPISAFSAIEHKHFKTFQLLINSGVDFNLIVNNTILLERCFNLINKNASNDTIMKSLKIIEGINFNDLNTEMFKFTGVKIEEKLNVINLISLDKYSFTNEIKNKIKEINDKYKLIKEYRELNLSLSLKDENQKRMKI